MLSIHGNAVFITYLECLVALIVLVMLYVWIHLKWLIYLDLF